MTRRILPPYRLVLRQTHRACRQRLLLTAWLLVAAVPATAQPVIMPVVPQPVRVPVNRIQAPGYVPPPPVVRRPWWFTVQTVSGPGAVVPVVRVTNYRPQPFRFPANAPVLAGKPILPPEGTPPARWAAAPAVTPAPSLPPQPQAAAPAPPPTAPPPPAAVARQPAPPAEQPAVGPPSRPAPSGQWATVAIDASQPQPNALAVTIPATPDGLLAASPTTPAPVAAQPVSHPAAAASPPQPTAPPAVVWWRCVGVTDGDTLTCLDAAGRSQKVVLVGVDAPELGQPYGREARELLAELAFGKRLAVAQVGRDAAGLAICRVAVDGGDVSAALVAAGAAWADPETGSSLTPEEQQARQARRGLWGEDTPVPPWEFRKGDSPAWQPAA